MACQRIRRRGQYVIGPAGERVYGVWVMTETVREDAPVIVQDRARE